MPNVQQLAQKMRWWCDNGNLGYDQSNRWDVRVGGECDCSSLVIAVLRQCGFDTGSATYTGNMRANLTANGWKIVARYPQNAAGLKAGDILLNDTNHVAMMVTDNGLLSQASIDERGRIAGGKAGDQSNYETNTKPFYVYGHGGWNVVLRYTGANMTTPATYTPISSGNKYNPNGYDAEYVKNVQRLLVKRGYQLVVDGILGPITFDSIKKFQASASIVVDGIPGPQTITALNGGSTQVKAAVQYTDIRKLQQAVRATPDNIYGPDTAKRIDAVRKASRWGGVKFPYGVAFTQSVVGTTPDGVWGNNSRTCHDNTVAAIQRAVGATADCIWGSNTEAAVNKAVNGARKP